ncbi:ABC transporter substrate-binding protein [Methanothrix sp.]|uniref:ABC transporter substrate-binding protein n=1 Tax=Methanothrix sp. TaxID=90426 RepID=UPI00329A656F
MNRSFKLPILWCSCVTLIAISLLCPAASADEDGQDLLSIFGNADMNDRIDEADATYVQAVIDGMSKATKLSDANIDGRIDSQDIERINEIIRGEETELTVSDSIGRNVTVSLPVKSIIALGTYRNEAAKILKAQDMMVGVSSDIKEGYYYQDLADKPAVGTWSAPDSEAIVKLKPDIVITSANLDRATLLEESLRPAGIAVLGLDLYREDIMRSEMRTLGFILDKNEEADEYLQWRGSYDQAIHDYVAGLNEYPKLDSEWILKENPDVIIKLLAPGGGKAGWNSTKEADQVLNGYLEERPGWSNLDASKNNRVHLLSTEIAWGPDGIVGLAYCTAWLHPEMDIDPEKIYREYLEQFLEVEYPEGAVLGYPVTA